MEGVLSDGMCRCCATEGSFKDFQVPYQWMGVEEIYGNMLKDCFDITLSVSEDINNGGICEVCITQLRNACNFKQQVQRTEEQFQKKMQESSFKPGGIKMEISRFEDEDSNLSADDFSSQEYEVPIKVEKVEEKPKKRAAAKASTSKAKKTKVSEGEPSVKRGRQFNAKKEITITLDRNTVTKNKKRKGIVKPEFVDIDDKLESKNRKTKENSEAPLRELLKHGNNLKVVLENSNATPIRYHIGSGYVCCFCTNQYPDPADLKEHTLNTHDSKDRHLYMKKQSPYGFILKVDITKLKCKLCDVSIETLQELFDHLQNIHKKIIYTDVKNQIVPFKFDDDQIKCVICALVFGKFKSLQEHMNTHYRNYVCDVCYAGCINRKILSRHMISHKTGSFKCDECTKVFNSAEKKRLHEYAVHKNGSLRSKCRLCEERFNTNHKRDKHMTKVHGVPPVIRKCMACEKTFTSQNALRVHNKRDHLMERRNRCTECSMSFYNRFQLKTHMLKHTGRKDFQCEFCLKTYGRLYTLKEHMRIHTDDRRFKCEHCGRAFFQKCSLRGHMRAIHGEIDT
ncbi:zinc finger protein 260-like isoform X4 [Maniola jurtina]|uniref:zinc finger protein 260-like isoform X4 n=1 Tax=Maniola jurtina TaxID=191418 RepID=UPI001E68B224|nr:zinc finger protein 260-like isoform X4 [Maniola jurtina]